MASQKPYGSGAQVQVRALQAGVKGETRPASGVLSWTHRAVPD
ncbi:hypothetical protein [Nocardiopsis alborubida]|nr:hypothetical protein [Nocardiopsis alborubida]